MMVMQSMRWVIQRQAGDLRERKSLERAYGEALG